MPNNSKKKTVYGVMNDILRQFESDHSLERSGNKAILAKLRNSIGREMSHSVDIYQYIFSKMPDEFLGKSRELTKQEKAIVITLQLYSLHQQGKEASVHFSTKDYEEMNTGKDGYSRKYNIGDSLSTIRIANDSIAMDRRFNFMILSSTIDELKMHLRGLINIFKSKGNIKIDYAKLADDLDWFQRGGEEGIRLSWTRSYYRNKKQEVKDGK